MSDTRPVNSAGHTIEAQTIESVPICRCYPQKCAYETWTSETDIQNLLLKWHSTAGPGGSPVVQTNPSGQHNPMLHIAAASSRAARVC